MVRSLTIVLGSLLVAACAAETADETEPVVEDPAPTEAAREAPKVDTDTAGPRMHWELPWYCRVSWPTIENSRLCWENACGVIDCR